MAGYQGRSVSLLTRHGKLQWLAPVLEPVTGAHIRLVSDFDTYLLGSFSRAIPRYASQLATARRKAELGMLLSGCEVGLASEGAFGVDPVSGLLPWNVEMLVWLDREQQFEIVGLAQGPARVLQQTIGSALELLTLARQFDFPAQGLLLRPNDAHDARIYSGGQNEAELLAVFEQVQAQASQQQVWLETDHRAFACPPRQLRIQQAAQDLAQKLLSTCPACNAPGFACQQKLTGLPCAWCHQPTRQVQAERWACVSCDYEQHRVRTDVCYADPATCDFCNP